MAVVNGSKLVGENWLLGKEQVFGYAAKDDPNHVLSRDGIVVKGPVEKARLQSNVKEVGVGLLKFATTGDFSPPLQGIHFQS